MFMSMGKEGSDVRALQEMLQQLGFFDGNVTGKYEETTKVGVARFQKENRIHPNGIADERTLMILAMRCATV